MNMKTQLFYLVGTALLSLVYAQSSRASSSTTSSAPVATHSIGVSPRLSANQFEPNTTFAKVGDIIEFHFFPPNHSVIRAPFQIPCIPYNYDQKGKSSSFFSGFRYLPGFANDGDEPKFSVRVNDTEPIFIYCGAPDSCLKKHMIGVINPNATWTLDAQLQPLLDGSAAYELLPGDPIPGEEELHPSSTSGASPSRTATPSSGANSNAPSDNSSHSLSGGAIAGIAIGGAAVVVLAAALIYLCGRKGGFEKGYRRSTQFAPSPGPMLEAKYNDPAKSPGAASTTVPDRSYTASPSQFSQTGSSGYNTYNSYNPYPSPPIGAQHPTMDGQHGHLSPYDPSKSASPPLPYQHPPVELPASSDPGNSPLPGYQPSRGMSWSANSENRYRPGK